MVIVVFNVGAEALDCKPSERNQLTEKAITQLRFITLGADEYMKRCKKEKRGKSIRSKNK